jgi:hypothetical protein
MGAPGKVSELYHRYLERYKQLSSLWDASVVSVTFGVARGPNSNRHPIHLLLPRHDQHLRAVIVLSDDDMGDVRGAEGRSFPPSWEL